MEIGSAAVRASPELFHQRRELAATLESYRSSRVDKSTVPSAAVELHSPAALQLSPGRAAGDRLLRWVQGACAPGARMSPQVPGQPIRGLQQAT